MPTLKRQAFQLNVLFENKVGFWDPECTYLCVCVCVCVCMYVSMYVCNSKYSCVLLE